VVKPCPLRPAFRSPLSLNLLSTPLSPEKLLSNCLFPVLWRSFFSQLSAVSLILSSVSRLQLFITSHLGFFFSRSGVTAFLNLTFPVIFRHPTELLVVQGPSSRMFTQSPCSRAVPHFCFSRPFQNRPWLLSPDRPCAPLQRRDHFSLFPGVVTVHSPLPCQ